MLPQLGPDGGNDAEVVLFYEPTVDFAHDVLVKLSFADWPRRSGEGLDECSFGALPSCANSAWMALQRIATSYPP